MSAAVLPVAILAGGLATRLRPLTETIPKALVDVNGEPFIAHQLRLLRTNGIDDVLICAGYLGEKIEAFVGDGTRYGVRVRVLFDGPRLLGTAGALVAARPYIDADAFFVLYGDSYLPCDYAAVQRAFQRQGQPALMTVYRNEGRWDESNVEFSDGRIVTYSKRARTPQMGYIDYGLGVLATGALDGVPPGQPYDLALLYESLVAHNALAAFEVDDRFYEIGSVAGLSELQRYLAA
jgi:NDP-sugar pyrophosphorylase family protein